MSGYLTFICWFFWSNMLDIGCDFFLHDKSIKWGIANVSDIVALAQSKMSLEADS